MSDDSGCVPALARQTLAVISPPMAKPVPRLTEIGARQISCECNGHITRILSWSHRGILAIDCHKSYCFRMENMNSFHNSRCALDRDVGNIGNCPISGYTCMYQAWRTIFIHYTLAGHLHGQPFVSGSCVARECDDLPLLLMQARRQAQMLSTAHKTKIPLCKASHGP